MGKIVTLSRELNKLKVDDKVYRSKDFILTDVIDIKGKKIGYISDILINFNKRKVIGVIVASHGLLKKSFTVFVEDIVSFNSVMVINNTVDKKFLAFNIIKGMDVTDRKGNILGMVEDILFDEADFNIKAMIVSTGFITNFIHGKKIILIRDLILGEENVLFNRNEEEVSFLSLPHKLFMEDLCHDREAKEKIN